jgi:hypothetical protein
MALRIDPPARNHRQRMQKHVIRPRTCKVVLFCQRLEINIVGCGRFGGKQLLPQLFSAHSGHNFIWYNTVMPQVIVRMFEL